MRFFRSALFLALLFAAPPVAAQQVLRVAVPALPASLDPHRALTIIERALAAEVFEGLVALDDHGRPVPGLAETWTVEDGGKRYTFELRAGLKWSDGRPLTADDVVAGLTRALDPATGAPLVALLLPVAHAAEFQLGTLAQGQALGIAALDRRRLAITLAAPSARFLHTLALPLAAPLPRHRIADLGGAWATPFLIVGSGAFVPAPAGDRYVLRRNANYYGRSAPTIERVELMTVASLEAANALIADDGADIALGFEPEPRLGRASRTSREEQGEAAYRFVVNVTRAPFDRREVRHALAMALDREEIIDDLKIGAARPAFSVVPPRMIDGYDPPDASYAKLGQEARAIIAQVLLLDLDRATPVPLRLAIPEGRVHAAIAARAAEVWLALGFAPEIVARDAAAHEAALLAGDFDVGVMTGGGRDADPWPFLFPLALAAGPLNVARYGEIEFDGRLTPADLESDAKSRLGALRYAEVALAEDQVVLPLVFFRPEGYVGRRVAGWTPNFTSTHPLKYLSVK